MARQAWQFVSMMYELWDERGQGVLTPSQFDRAAHFKFTLGAGDVIKGWAVGVVGMREGEKARKQRKAALQKHKSQQAPDRRA